ncbi:MAG: FAD-dependent oxidoreductase [Alphaproteobacteria bacterium]|nr:FAD-dependent oxidoreductase [Alphaproteobacteria bacterium]
MGGIVIIGAGMAGARACINLRASGYEGEITLIGEEVHLPYDRPPLSKSTITDEQEAGPIWLLDHSIVDSLKLKTLLGMHVDSLDTAGKAVVLGDGRRVAYDKLLLATGAKPRKLPGASGDHALTLRDHRDAIELRRRFQPGKSIVVIGGGFIGLEVASSALKRGCSVALVEMQPRILMRGVPEAIAKIVHDRHVQAGVNMCVGVGIAEITAHAVKLADGREIVADTIIAGIGAAPEIRLAQQAGLAIENGIACNAELQTSEPDIYAAGDCCSFPHELFAGRRMRLEAWRNAQEQAATVAENLLGGHKAHTNIPWFWSDQYDLSLQIAGVADLGPHVVQRVPAPGALLLFHLADDGRLMGVSGIGPGNSVARDVKLAEMMIAKQMKPAAAALADVSVPLKSLMKG